VPGTYTTDLYNVSAGTVLKVTPHVTLKSGNLTMQRHNTGLGGDKTFNQTMLLNRMAPWLLDRDKGGEQAGAH
jgi:hypothetical protein